MDHDSFDRAASFSIREIVFGLEDSLVSTLGAVTGIAAGTHDAYTVVLSGLVLIAVEAISMSAGSYLSSKSAAGVEAQMPHPRMHRGDHPPILPLRGAFVMGVSYLIGGFFPLAPYLFLSVSTALWPSVFLTAVVLYATGAWTGHLIKRSSRRSGIEMVAISLLAAGIGYAIGRVVSTFFGVDGFS
jgi:VIT1/CCC1 family predicted Fe2+/Mn2+ transporter